MGRSVRKVPADWKHPVEYSLNPQTRNWEPGFVPMYSSEQWTTRCMDYWGGFEKWKKDEEDGLCGSSRCYVEYDGPPPNPRDYMPQWPQSERTHLMMYEDTSEGTPISPAFTTPEELALWLNKTSASIFADRTASYKTWLDIASEAHAPQTQYAAGVAAPIQKEAPMYHDPVTAIRSACEQQPKDGLVGSSEEVRKLFETRKCLRVSILKTDGSSYKNPSPTICLFDSENDRSGGIKFKMGASDSDDEVTRARTAILDQLGITVTGADFLNNSAYQIELNALMNGLTNSTVVKITMTWEGKPADDDLFTRPMDILRAIKSGDFILAKSLGLHITKEIVAKQYFDDRLESEAGPLPTIKYTFDLEFQYN